MDIALQLGQAQSSWFNAVGLMDSGSQLNVIDNSIATQQGWTMSSNTPPCAYSFEGTPLTLQAEYHLQVQVTDSEGTTCTALQVFYGCDTPSYPVVLGMPWLESHIAGEYNWRDKKW